MSLLTDVDTLVIGSGAGGLTAAVALAQAGQKVLVLEQHYLPGGWCHSFTLGDGYRFSPGVHYVGELQPGGRMRRIYEGLGLGRDLAFRELDPDGYDRFLVAGQRFDVPAGKERFFDRLASRFPAETAGIRRYLDICDRLGQELDGLADLSGVLDMIKVPFRAPTVARWGFSSAKSLINSCVKDPLLRAYLAAQSGDHGLPPSLAPAALHASVVAHYLPGGWYPQGGGAAIPRALIRALRRAGGEILVRTAVKKILLDGRRAIGVRLDDGTEIRARKIISNADPQVTFSRLVGEEHLSSRLRRRLKKTRWSTSALSLFLATDLDPRSVGLTSANVWWYPHHDLDAIYRRGMEVWDDKEPELPGLFLTVPTLKDPQKLRGGRHTIESFTFVHHDAFKAWADSKTGGRPAAYEALKARLTEKMIAAADRVYPGLKDRVLFAELGTPLTNVFYCAATLGNLYGTEKCASQVGPRAYPISTEFEDLYLVGASTVAHGVLGATMSGLLAARALLHCRVSDLLKTGGPPLSVLSSAAPPPRRILSAEPEDARA